MRGEELSPKLPGLLHPGQMNAVFTGSPGAKPALVLQLGQTMSVPVAIMDDPPSVTILDGPGVDFLLLPQEGRVGRRGRAPTDPPSPSFPYPGVNLNPEKETDEPKNAWRMAGEARSLA